MSTYVILLRAVNVGGIMLTTRDFVAALTAVGLKNVRTYIQTGNAVADGPGMEPRKVAEQIKGRIQRSRGIACAVIVLTPEELARALRANPYPSAEAKPPTLHLMFLDAKPVAPDLALLEKVRAPTEEFQLKGRIFYLHAPDGVGRSRLVPRIERALGRAGTARNWRTASKLLELARPASA